MSNIKPTRLGDVLRITSGFAFKSNLFNGKDGMALVRIRDVGKGFSDTYYSGPYEERYVVNNGDLLVSMDGEFRIEPWRGGPALLNQRVCRLEPDPQRLNATFLRYRIDPELKKIENATPYVTVKHLSAKSLEELVLPLPPLAEQQRIGALLDKADTIRRKRREAIALASRILQSAFIELFGDPLANPLAWPMVPLNNFLAFITSGSRGWAEHYVDHGKRFIRSLDVQMNELSGEEPSYVDPPEGTEADRTRVRDGDVLLTITGSKIGRVAFVPDGFGEAYVSQHVAILRLNSELRPRFLSMFLSLPNGGQLQIGRSQYGQTKPGLSLEQLRKFVVPKVPVPEQDRYCKFWSKHEHLLFRANAASRETNSLFESLVQRAFRGEL